MFHPKCISFGGGVSSYHSVLGFLHKFEKKNFLEKIEMYSSTGTGCLFSVCMCLGMETDQIRCLLEEFSEIDDSFSASDSTKTGSSNFSRLRSFFEKLFHDNLKHIPSFHQLYLLTKKELFLSAYNLTKETHCYFSRGTTPHMNVVSAICLSCCHNTSEFPMRYEEERYTDGCFFNPLPVTCFPKKMEILAIRSTDTIFLKSDVLRNSDLCLRSLSIAVAFSRNTVLVELRKNPGESEEDEIISGHDAAKKLLSKEKIKTPFVFVFPEMF